MEKIKPQEFELLRPVLDEIVKTVAATLNKPSSQEINALLHRFQIAKPEEYFSLLEKCSKLFFDLTRLPSARGYYSKYFSDLGIPEEYIIKIITKLTGVPQEIVQEEVISQNQKELESPKQVEKAKKSQKLQDTVSGSPVNRKNEMPSDNLEFEEETQTKETDFEIKDSMLLAYHGSEKNLVIPETIHGQKVVQIGQGAFSSKGLITVSIPNSVKKIGERAFWHNRLEAVKFPYGLTDIGSSCFESNDLKHIEFPKSVTSIKSSAFARNQLKSISFPNSVKVIGSNAFMHNCLESVKFPSGLTEISSRCFEFNDLKHIEIPKSVTHIRRGAFGGNKLTNIVIPNNVTHIGNHAFAGNQLTNIIIPNNVTDLGKNAFSHNRLKSISLSAKSKLTSLPFGCFSHNQIRKVIIPISLSFISEEAFFHNNLKKVVFRGEKHIARAAFNSNKLKRVSLPKKTSFSPYSFDSNVLIKRKNHTFQSREGWVFIFLPLIIFALLLIFTLLNTSSTAPFGEPTSRAWIMYTAYVNQTKTADAKGTLIYNNKLTSTANAKNQEVTKTPTPTIEARNATIYATRTQNAKITPTPTKIYIYEQFNTSKLNTNNWIPRTYVEGNGPGEHLSFEIEPVLDCLKITSSDRVPDYSSLSFYTVEKIIKSNDTNQTVSLSADVKVSNLKGEYGGADIDFIIDDFDEPEETGFWIISCGFRLNREGDTKLDCYSGYIFDYQKDFRFDQVISQEEWYGLTIQYNPALAQVTFMLDDEVIYQRVIDGLLTDELQEERYYRMNFGLTASELTGTVFFDNVTFTDQ